MLIGRNTEFILKIDYFSHGTGMSTATRANMFIYIEGRGASMISSPKYLYLYPEVTAFDWHFDIFL